MTRPGSGRPRNDGTQSTNRPRQLFSAPVSETGPCSDHGKLDCRILAVGKRRDGRTRYWCLAHRADATTKYGRPAEECRAARMPPISSENRLVLNVDSYLGGVALWGAVPPVYDTTRKSFDQGIHVHARTEVGGQKVIDKTFLAVKMVGTSFPPEGLEASDIDAIYFMVSSVFGHDVKQVLCSHCGYSHLDKDWFSVHPHRRHLCAGCGRHFSDDEIAIGNPIGGILDQFSLTQQEPQETNRALDISQDDFPGGIQVWGSNPAFLWTSEKREEAGIHVHAFENDSEVPSVDNTFGSVAIDGVSLDPTMVRVLMAQLSLPHLRHRIVSCSCPECGDLQFSRDQRAYTDAVKHVCVQCGHSYTARGRIRRTVANPLLASLESLGSRAPRPPQEHVLNLLSEAP